MSLKNKTALITGSTSGIGLGIAKALANQGANIILNGFGDVDAAIGEVSSAGSRVEYHPADLSKPLEIESLMGFAASKFDQVDILVNNAGIQHVASLEDFRVEHWDAILAVNLSAAFHTTRLALPAMRASNWGRIINMGSVHALVASVNKAAYVAAKHGIVGLTKVTALETATTGITCNAICPGWVRTPLALKQVEDKAKTLNISLEEATKLSLGEKEPSMQFTTTDDIGQLALFFCSPAGHNVRGVAWSMDGGWTAQ
ncbi:3-hydroxybutyrate dehydrogenase [Rhodoferax sp.]|uniref:3-hydroxybutyrate dehydrogenase n=1 Tax=Rhodoferax sp. TaxID=50421 RepID=UPI00260F23B5|nr:3-hydroxybutyrate dehydrogenase [Rhodoferax sp.]MDD3937863.1 3-hydroxybutyrate dehydrogenase [Rhodoferax sp.]